MADQSRAVGLRGKERNEEIGGVHDAGTFVFNKDLNAISFLTPAKRDVSMCFKRGINSVVHQIDQRLFNLRRVYANSRFRTRPDLNLEPGFQIHDTLYQRGKIDVLLLRRRKLCQPSVSLQETAQRIGARGDGIQPGVCILFPVRWQRARAAAVIPNWRQAI